MGTVFGNFQTKPLTMKLVIIAFASLLLTSNCEPEADPQFPIIPYALQPRPYFAPHFFQPYMQLATYPAITYPGATYPAAIREKKVATEVSVQPYASRSEREFWDEFYTLHNKYRDDNNLGELHIDVNIEEILESAGYVTGHGHSARQRLNDYAKRVTKTTWKPEALENFAGSFGGRLTPAELLREWQNSNGHNRTILGQKGPKWDAFGCAMARSGNSYSYLCAYREKGTCGSVSYTRTAYGSVSYLRCKDRNCC